MRLYNRSSLMITSFDTNLATSALMTLSQSIRENSVCYSSDYFAVLAYKIMFSSYFQQKLNVLMLSKISKSKIQDCMPENMLIV